MADTESQIFIQPADSNAGGTVAHPWIALAEQNSDLDEAVLYSLDELRLA